MDYFAYVKAAMEYIEYHLSVDVRYEDLAVMTGFSPSHFRVVFRAATGESITSYIRKRRLLNAAWDLSHSQRRVIDIAMAYGFNSHEVFSRAFKREFGVLPCQFRDEGLSIERPLTTSQLFGPAILRRDARLYPLGSQRGMEVGEGKVLLHGINRVGYYREDSMELNPLISSLKSCLEYLGQPVNYPYLMFASGLSCRLTWSRGQWDLGCGSIFDFRPDPLEPLVRVMASLGRRYEFLLRPTLEGHRIASTTSKPLRMGGEAEFMALIKHEIGAGRPLIALGLVGPPEPCLITGYREGGRALLGWSFYQDYPEFSASLGRHPEGYFVKENWFEDTLALLAIGEESPITDPDDFLRETLKYALSILETERIGDRLGGQVAYGAWAEDLLDEGAFPRKAGLPWLLTRFRAHSAALLAIGEGRWCAYDYLQTVAQPLGAGRESLLAAAKAFKDQHHLAWELVSLVGGIGMGEPQARNLAKREVREKSANLIYRAQEVDGLAVLHLKNALEIIEQASAS